MWALILIAKKNINKLFPLYIFSFFYTSLPLYAQKVQFSQSDSLNITIWLKQAPSLSNEENKIMFFANKFLNVPYVAGTLDKNKAETLVINTRELDCTTFVENVLALTLCAKNHQTSFDSFCKYLKQIRYKDAIISYPTRLHYFIDWIENNTKSQFVKEITATHNPFTAKGIHQISYMSENAYKYPMLRANSVWIKEIKKREKKLSGKPFIYIPKELLKNNDALKNSIKDGDIIAIITAKKGLDTSHIGLACWHKNTLHLFNASKIRGKVVNEPSTLYDYMKTQRFQKGIIVIRINS